MNNGEVKDICKLFNTYNTYDLSIKCYSSNIFLDHCFYIFFICTDHVGSWPSNQNSCMDYYQKCADIVENAEFTNTNAEYSNNNTTSTINDTFLGKFFVFFFVFSFCKFGLSESSCNDILKKGKIESGIYKIKLGSKVKSVYCDMESKGGGWTIIQRRGDFGRPRDFFLRNWLDYKDGFGDPAEDFWLGLDGIHNLGIAHEQQLLITLEDFESNKTSLIVNNFQIGNESSEYAITYKNYNNKIGNSLPSRGTKFSTIDRDNDLWKGNCAKKFSGAWWYSACHNSNLNGLYLRKNHTSFGNGVNWFHLRGYHYSLKNTEMKVRAKEKKTK